MVKKIDTLEREREILKLIVKSYIEESRPISSLYLCEKYNLSYSTATVRNIMESLEKKGYLLHIHTSSGRIPTQEAFKYYVRNLKEEDIKKDNQLDLCLKSIDLNNLDDAISYMLEVLSKLSGYISLFTFLGKSEKFFLRGIRFIFRHPEFEDIEKLKKLFYILEVKINALHDLLFNSFKDDFRIFVGDEIGLKEISDCSLVISALNDKEISYALGLLGPIRMNYIKAVSYLSTIKNKVKDIIEDYYEESK